MSIETATQRLKDANPVPEPALLRRETDDLSALLLATWQRSMNVQTQQITKMTPKHKPQKRGWLIAVAVAVATIVVISAAALLSLTQGVNDVATTPTTLNSAPVPTTEAPPDTATTSIAVPAGPTTFEVEAFDYGFRGLPAELVTGDALELVNGSVTEYHNLVVIRLDPDDTRTIEQFAVLPPEAFGAETPQPGFNIVGGLHAAPGEGAFDGRIRLQAPGKYLVIDMVPQGADPAVVEEAVASESPAPPYQVPGGLLGYEHGMIAIVTVMAK